MTIATASKKSASAAAVFYTPIKESKSLLFVSNEKSEHIMNCKEKSHCAATIQEDGLDWSAIKGLQIKGEIYLADEKYWTNYLEKYPYIKSDKVLFLTNVDGLLMDEKLVDTLTLAKAKEILPQIGFGMEKKILAATEALEMGVSEALIANGQKENPISSAIAHDNCTVITK